jgi:dTDP-4-amino-4,6-dideoxygalactose transaminase
MKFLNKNGIETRIFHEPLACDAPIYKNLKKRKVPFARRVLKESLIIPLNDKLKKKDVDFIILTIKSFFKKKYKTLK